jgi:hypothetical protein
VTTQKRNPPVFGVEAQEAFLQLVGEGWPPKRAADAIKVKIRTIESKKARDKDFAEEYRIARLAGAEVLLEEMQRRGVEGVLEPVFYQGEIVGHVRKYSDRTLVELAKGARPDMFDQRTNVDVHVTAALTIDHLVDLRALGRDDAAHAELERMADQFVDIHEGKVPAAIPSET